MPETPMITIEAVNKFYGIYKALDDVSLDVDAHDVICLIGSSGSGKSTLMNILGCLDRPTTGRYRFMGRDVSELERDELAELPYNLIATGTAADNVEVPAIYAGIPPAQRHARALELLGSLGLDDRAHHRPNQLSGGQQQRVSIARALMNGGRIILADEPTGALDSHSGAEVMALLHELADAGHTIVLITHDREVAAQARRVIEIRDGQIVADSGRADEGTAAPAP
eukprot:gene1310-1726_t